MPEHNQQRIRWGGIVETGYAGRHLYGNSPQGKPIIGSNVRFRQKISLMLQTAAIGGMDGCAALSFVATAIRAGCVRCKAIDLIGTAFC